MAGKVIHNFYTLRDIDGNIIVGMSYIQGRFVIDCASDIDCDYTPEQLQNPQIAVTRFLSLCGDALRGRVKAAQAQKHHNPIMGCDVDMPCTECAELGKYQQACCPYNGTAIIAGLMRGGEPDASNHSG